MRNGSRIRIEARRIQTGRHHQRMLTLQRHDMRRGISRNPTSRRTTWISWTTQREGEGQRKRINTRARLTSTLCYGHPTKHFRITQQTNLMKMERRKIQLKSLNDKRFSLSYVSDSGPSQLQTLNKYFPVPTGCCRLLQTSTARF